MLMASSKDTSKRYKYNDTILLNNVIIQFSLQKYNLLNNLKKPIKRRIFTNKI